MRAREAKHLMIGTQCTLPSTARERPGCLELPLPRCLVQHSGGPSVDQTVTAGSQRAVRSTHTKPLINDVVIEVAETDTHPCSLHRARATASLRSAWLEGVSLATLHDAIASVIYVGFLWMLIIACLPLGLRDLSSAGLDFFRYFYFAWLAAYGSVTSLFLFIASLADASSSAFRSTAITCLVLQIGQTLAHYILVFGFDFEVNPLATLIASLPSAHYILKMIYLRYKNLRQRSPGCKKGFESIATTI